MNGAGSEIIEDLWLPLAIGYVGAAALNVGAAWRSWRAKSAAQAVAWLCFAGLFALLAARSFVGQPVELPASLKAAIDAAAAPWSVTLAAYALFAAAWLGRRWFVRPAVAWPLLNAGLLGFGLSLPDPNFAAVAAAPDNLPIVAMVFLFAVFLWLAAAQAVENDRRAVASEPLVEKGYQDKVLVWPDLVYIELIAMLLVGTLLLVWSLLVRAPLEPPADPAVTPNPSKAPWYFVGLQELLSYSDAWWAGVIVPCLILLGLAAIPYLDRSREGSGYYSLGNRRFATVVFLFGLLMLWILPILVGTFMRGPNWSFFGPYEPRDLHKIGSVANVKLSEWFWTGVLGRQVPQVAADVRGLPRLGAALGREAIGLSLLAIYLLGVPLALGCTSLGPLRQRLGRWRYWLMMLLLLLMLSLPLKMFLHWSCNLSYLVSLPEYSWNF